MKITLKTKDKGIRTLVDTLSDPLYPDGYLTLDGAEISSEDDSLLEWEELQEIGYNNLKGDMRKRYSELKALHS